MKCVCRPLGLPSREEAVSEDRTANQSDRPLARVPGRPRYGRNAPGSGLSEAARPGARLLAVGDESEMNVVGHQTIGQMTAVLAALVRQKIAIKRVLVLAKNTRSRVPRSRDVMATTNRMRGVRPTFVREDRLGSTESLPASRACRVLKNVDIKAARAYEAACRPVPAALRAVSLHRRPLR